MCPGIRTAPPMMVWSADHQPKDTSKRIPSYTGFVSEVSANKVSTAAITSAGSVSGKLHDGDAYTSQIPTALNGNAFSPCCSGTRFR
jgi:hypothetical protein